MHTRLDYNSMHEHKRKVECVRNKIHILYMRNRDINTLPKLEEVAYMSIMNFLEGLMLRWSWSSLGTRTSLMHLLCRAS